MKVLSLFDGISGCQQALKNLGIEFDGINNVYYASEVDKYAIQVTQKNFPNTVQLGDVKKIFYASIDEYALLQYHNKCNTKCIIDIIGKIDLLCGGSPCQDLSIAKKDRKGLEGEKSGLFWEYVRILKAVKPKYFLLENVASMTKVNKDLITKTLGVEPILINSSLVTAQQRKRFYWTNIPNFGIPQDKGIFLKDILESGQTYQEKSYALTATYDKAVFWNTLEKKQRSMVIEPIGCAIRGRYNTNGKTEQTLELRNDDKANCITSVSKDSLVCEPIRLGHFNKGGQGDRVYSIEGKSICLSANGGGKGAKTGLYKIDLPDGDYIVRKLTPTECERLQGFPDGYTEGVSNSQRYKSLGNGFTVPVIEYILSHAFKRISIKIKEEFYHKPLVKTYERVAINLNQNSDIFNQTNQSINV